MGNEIENISIYNERMRKSLVDKIFFIDKVDADVFVDFGCADGAVLGYLQELFPEYTYIGYDINMEMIQLAQTAHPNILFVAHKEILLTDLKKLKSEGHKICLICNSVIHEIYSYSSYDDIEDFYKFIFGEFFDYIAIRDMMPNKSINRPADINDIAKVRALANNRQLEEFEDFFGSIDNNKNLVHFLLKYKYIENWAREVRENYFPITTQQFISRIPRGYSIDYYTEYLLPYIKTLVESDYDIVIKDTTHLKIILRKNH